MHRSAYSIYPLGDSALIIGFGDVIEESVNRKVLSLSRRIKQACIVGVLDVATAYSSITVHYDVIEVIKKHPGKPAFVTIKENLETLLSQPTEGFSEHMRRLKVPVCYAAKYAPDINDIALHTNLTVEDIVQLHTSIKYRVYMVGFLPGFAYMGEVDERIAVPRKQEPRLQVVAGSVGIAGRQTGIYPLTSPGGWQIIGRTPLKLFDKNKQEPVLITAGDEVEFFSITEDEFDNY